MKLVTEYLEQVAEFDRMAAEATNPELKASLQNQAEACYKLAVNQAKRTGLPIPARSPSQTETSSDEG
jgi:hypothetical protein